MQGKGALSVAERRRVEVKAPGIIARKVVHKPMQIGLKVIDSLVPIGCGQQKLIIINIQTRKIVKAIDTILNQKKINVLNNEKLYYVYVVIERNIHPWHN